MKVSLNWRYGIILADIIKQFRLVKGYTQKEVADLLGVSRSTYCCYEIGRIRPDLSTIMKLSEIFQVHYSELLESEKQFCFNKGGRLSDIGNVFDSKLQFSYLSDEEKYFIVAFRLLSEDDRKEVMGLILDKFKSIKNKGDLE